MRQNTIAQRAILLIFGLIIFASGCTSSEGKARVFAEDFLKSYCATDYQRAASMCTEDLSKEIMEAAKDFNSLSPEVRKELALSSSKIRTEVVECSSPAKGIFVFNYKMYLPDTDIPVQNTLTLTQTEGQWKISSL